MGENDSGIEDGEKIIQDHREDDDVVEHAKDWDPIGDDIEWGNHEGDHRKEDFFVASGDAFVVGRVNKEIF